MLRMSPLAYASNQMGYAAMDRQYLIPNRENPSAPDHLFTAENREGVSSSAADCFLELELKIGLNLLILCGHSSWW